MISFHTDQKIALIEQKNSKKFTTIQPVPRSSFPRQIYKQIEEHVEEIVALLTI